MSLQLPPRMRGRSPDAAAAAVDGCCGGARSSGAVPPSQSHFVSARRWQGKAPLVLTGYGLDAQLRAEGLAEVAAVLRRRRRRAGQKRRHGEPVRAAPKERPPSLPAPKRWRGRASLAAAAAAAAAAVLHPLTRESSSYVAPCHSCLRLWRMALICGRAGGASRTARLLWTPARHASMVRPLSLLRLEAGATRSPQRRSQRHRRSLALPRRPDAPARATHAPQNAEQGAPLALS